MSKSRVFTPFIMNLHVVDTLVPVRLLKKCYKVSSIGLLCLKMPFEFYKTCSRCQMVGRISKWNMMPLNLILGIELFNIWGIGFMGLFPSSFGNQYILVVVDYIPKWVESIPSKINDNKFVVRLLKENIFSCFRPFRVIISYNDTHFCNRSFEALMRKYVIAHKLSTPYHPQTSEKIKFSNRQIKLIL